MNSFQLKILALTTMVIDHVGAIFFPQIFLFRVIGRLSFPIFAFLVSEGVRHTSNPRKYITRMAIFAIISEPAFLFAFGGTSHNIFFTLLLGALSIVAWQKITSKPFAIFFVSAMAITAMFFRFDYSFYGVLLPLLFYVYDRRNIPALYTIFSTLTIAYIVFSIFNYRLDVSKFSIWPYIQIFSAFSIFIVGRYNGEQGRKLKYYFFYWFYPVHLAVLASISYLLKLKNIL